MPVSHFSLIFAPSFPFDLARTIHADTRVSCGDYMSFLREGREVFRVAAQHVSALGEHDNQREADEAVRAHRERQAGAGAASAHVAEVGTAPRSHPRFRHQSQRGAVAEGFSLRVKEQP